MLLLTDRPSQLIGSSSARLLDKAQISTAKPIEWVKESGTRTTGQACVPTGTCLVGGQSSSNLRLTPTIFRFIVAFLSPRGRVRHSDHGRFLPNPFQFIVRQSFCRQSVSLTAVVRCQTFCCYVRQQQLRREAADGIFMGLFNFAESISADSITAYFPVKQLRVMQRTFRFVSSQNKQCVFYEVGTQVFKYNAGMLFLQNV